MALYNTLCDRKHSCPPIDEICDIFVSIHFEYHNDTYYDKETPPNQYLLADIRSDWECKLLYRRCIRTQEELVLFLHDITKLKYSKLDDSLYLEEDHLPSNTYKKILELIPENTNIKLSIHDCSVCLDLTKTKTSCNHFICSLCESKLTVKKCPTCREYYNHPLNEDDDE